MLMALVKVDVHLFFLESGHGEAHLLPMSSREIFLNCFVLTTANVQFRFSATGSRYPPFSFLWKTRVGKGVVLCAESLVAVEPF